MKKSKVKKIKVKEIKGERNQGETNEGVISMYEKYTRRDFTGIELESVKNEMP